MQIDFDSADAPGFLEFAQVKFGTEKSFCLPENCSNNVGFFNYTFNFKSSVYNVLYRKCLGCSRKYATPVCKLYFILIMLIALVRVFPAR